MHFHSGKTSPLIENCSHFLAEHSKRSHGTGSILQCLYKLLVTLQYKFGLIKMPFLSLLWSVATEKVSSFLRLVNVTHKGARAGVVRDRDADLMPVRAEEEGRGELARKSLRPAKL